MASVLPLTPWVTFSESLDAVWSVAWSGNGKLFAVCGSDCLIRIYVEEGFDLPELFLLNTVGLCCLYLI